MNVTKQRLMDYVIIETIISIFYIFFLSNNVFGLFSYPVFLRSARFPYFFTPNICICHFFIVPLQRQR